MKKKIDNEGGPATANANFNTKKKFNVVKNNNIDEYTQTNQKVIKLKNYKRCYNKRLIT